MTTPNPAYAYENLTHGGLLKVNSKDSRDVSLTMDVFGGNTAFAIFTGAGGKPWKTTISRKIIPTIVRLLRRIQENVGVCREPFEYNQWDPEAKRMKPLAQFAFGIDESMTFFIEVAANDLQGRHIFPIKPDNRWNFGNSTMLTEKDQILGVIDYLIAELSLDSLFAERMTSFKRQNTGGGGFGGNRGGNGGGGGGNRNWSNNGGGGNGGGGNRGNWSNNNQGGGNSQKQGTFSGGDDSSDLDLVL